MRPLPFGGAADCRAAIDAAAAAFPAWAGRTPYERGAILKRAADLIRERADALAHTTVLESGKPQVQARGEWMVAADLFEWFAEEGKRAYGRTIPSRVGTRRLTVLKQPIGVAGIITAWNFPAYNVARAAAAALAAGCTVVLRPSEYTPLTAIEMVNVLVDASLPDGVVNLVNGEADPIGQAMLDHPACAKVHLTGSVRVGKHLMDGASRTMTRLSLELGGNAPVLVFPDVDLEAGCRRCGGGEVPQQRTGVHRAAAVPRREAGRRRISRTTLQPWPARCASAPGSIRRRRWARSSTRGSAIASRRWSTPRARPARRSASAAPGRRSSRAATSISQPSSATSSRRCRSTRKRSSDR